MARVALLALVLIPSLAAAFEAGDQVVCTRSCEVKHDDKWEATFHAGDALVVAAAKDGQVRIQKLLGWMPAEHLVAADDAIAHFRERLARDPDDGEARCGLAVSLVRTAANEALAEVNEAVRRAENWQTLRAKALVHWGRPNESVQALALLDRIITDEPKRLELRVLRARFLAESGQEYRAAGDDSYVLKHGGPLSYVLQHRAATWLVANEWQKARADYAATLALDPDNDDWTVMLIGLDSWDEPETALAKIQEFLDRKPKTFSAWYLKGQIELKQQRRAEATDDFTRALEIAPNHAQALACRARSETQETIDLALDDLNKALDLEPHNAGHWAWRAFFFQQLGKSQLAVADYSAAIRLRPDIYWLYKYRGEIYQTWSEYHLAAADYEAATRLEDCDPETRKLLAQLYATCPDPTIRDGEAALRIIDELEKREPGLAATCVGDRAAAYAAIGQFEMAVVTQRKISSPQTASPGGAYAPFPKVAERGELFSLPPTVGGGRLALYEARKPYLLPSRTVSRAPEPKFGAGDRVVCIRTWEMVDDGKPQGLVLAGREWMVEGIEGDQVKFGDRWIPADHVILKQDAVAFLRKQLEDDPEDVESRSALAVQLVESDPDAALAEASEAVRRHKSWFTLHRQATVQYDRREFLLAMKTLDEAKSLFPERLEVRELRAPLAYNIGYYRRAIDDNTVLIARYPTAAKYLVQRGLAWSTLEKGEKAQADFDAALRLEPGNISCLLYRVASLIPLDKLDEALVAAEELVARDPENFSVHQMKGMVLCHKHDAEGAIESLTRALELKHDQAETFLLRAGCWMELSETELALADSSKAIELAPLKDAGWGLRGTVHLARRDYDLALADWDEADRLEPKKHAWHLIRAALWEEKGEYERAINELQALLQHNPKSQEATAALALIYASCPDDKVRDGRKARGLVSNAYYWSTSANHDVAESLAAAYAELGDFPKAIRVQQKALTAASDPAKERSDRARLELYEAGKPYRTSITRR